MKNKAPEITVVTVAAPVIEIAATRYEQLIAKEKELQLLKNSLAVSENYINIGEIKRIFKIESEEAKNA